MTLYNLLATNDYVGVDFLLIFRPDSLSSYILCQNITVIADQLVEEFENFIVSVEGTDSSLSITRNTATITIIDDSCRFCPYVANTIPTHCFLLCIVVRLLHVIFSEEAYSVSENAGSIEVCISLTGEVDRNVDVEIMTKDLSASCKFYCQQVYLYLILLSLCSVSGLSAINILTSDLQCHPETTLQNSHD